MFHIDFTCEDRKGIKELIYKINRLVVCFSCDIGERRENCVFRDETSRHNTIPNLDSEYKALIWNTEPMERPDHYCEVSRKETFYSFSCSLNYPDVIHLISKYAFNRVVRLEYTNMSYELFMKFQHKENFTDFVNINKAILLDLEDQNLKRYIENIV